MDETNIHQLGCSVNSVMSVSAEQTGRRRPPTNTKTNVRVRAHTHTHTHTHKILPTSWRWKCVPVLGRFYKEATQQESWSMSKEVKNILPGFQRNSSKNLVLKLKKKKVFMISFVFKVFHEALLWFRLFILIYLVPAQSHSAWHTVGYVA